jgi:hypothetical protein
MTGAVIRTMDLRASYGDTFEVDHAPLIADFNGDGIKDVFIVGGKARYPNINVNYGKAYCLSWGAGKGPDWTMFRHDVRRSACLCDAAGLPIPPLSAPATVLSDRALRVFPNPVRNELHLEALLDGSGEVSIHILDATGKLVLNERVAAQRQFSWKGNIEALAAGKYLVELQGDGVILYGHFTFLR